MKVSFLTQSGYGDTGILIRPRLRLLPRVQKAPGVLKLFVIKDPNIDPLDAVRASVGYVNQTFKDRRIITPQITERVFEDMLLGHLANTPVRKWTDFMWQCIKEQSRLSRGNFLKRFGGAMVNGKGHWLNEYKFFILRNWRSLLATTARRAGLQEKFPGLKDWHPDAASWLMMKVRVRAASGCTAKLFTNERERCLLPGKSRGRYRVTLKNERPYLNPS